MDGVAWSKAGQVGLEPTTPAFGERCSAKLSYWPKRGRGAGLSTRPQPDYNLLRLPVRRVFSAVWAELIQFHTPRIIAAVFFRGVIPRFAIIASQGDYGANIFLF